VEGGSTSGHGPSARTMPDFSHGCPSARTAESGRLMITLAHYWGIDEVGIYLIPALLAIASVRWMEKRSRRSAEDREKEMGAEQSENSDNS